MSKSISPNGAFIGRDRTIPTQREAIDRVRSWEDEREVREVFKASSASEAVQEANHV